MARLELGHAQTDTLLSLGQERFTWLDLRRRVGRTAGLDSNLNGQFDDSNRRMNNLLETYHGLLQETVEFVPTPSFDIPIKHTHDVYEVNENA